ncbi:hypothetical protein FS749_011258 [Ceratobasidium sp. UAMH 11750]|nr:hypothetical protein FS749_011258 [Ceratobasidium sp. UAMH 11750]
MVACGTLNILPPFSPPGKTETYFFLENKYCKIAWSQGGRDTVVSGPSDIFNGWRTLKEAGFARVDATLPIPGNVNKAYFFSGSQYARIQFTPGSSEERILGGVHSISDWRSLTKAGFDHVDAAMIVPGTTDQAYIFSDTRMCRISFREGTSDGDELLDGPHVIRARWGKLGFLRVNRIVPNPHAPEQAYVFAGTLAARISITREGDANVEVGPTPAAGYWPSLHEAGFY